MKTLFRFTLTKIILTLLLSLLCYFLTLKYSLGIISEILFLIFYYPLGAVTWALLPSLNRFYDVILFLLSLVPFYIAVSLFTYLYTKKKGLALIIIAMILISGAAYYVKYEFCALGGWGFDISCGRRIPRYNEFVWGDECKQFARCEINRGACQLVKTPTYDECKTCIERCDIEYSKHQEFENCVKQNCPYRFAP